MEKKKKVLHFYATINIFKVSTQKKTHAHMKTYPWMYIIHNSRNLEDAKHLSIDEWINK